MKCTIVINDTLGMSTGKIASQVGHATLEAFRQSPGKKKDGWLKKGQPIIVLKANYDTIKDIITNATVQVHNIIDEGRTEVSSNTLTAIALGPDNETAIDTLTSDLLKV